MNATDIRNGPYSSYYLLHGLFILRLPDSSLPKSKTNTGTMQLYCIHHLYTMALHASEVITV